MYRLLSAGFRVRSDIPGVARRLADLLRPFEVDDLNGDARDVVVSRDAGYFAAIVDGGVAFRSARVEAVVDWLVWRASVEAIAGAHDHLVIHAGAVGYPGGAVLLPAPPESGKSTMTAALTAVGFTYFSDEAALIDPSSGSLVPFPRALWLEEGSVAALEALLRGRGALARSGGSHVAPARLNGGKIACPSPIRHVVFPTYVPKTRTRLTPITRGEAAVELGRNSLNLDTFGSWGVDVLARVVRGADAHRLTVSDLGMAIAAVESLTGDPKRATQPTEEASAASWPS